VRHLRAATLVCLCGLILTLAACGGGGSDKKTGPKAAAAEFAPPKADGAKPVPGGSLSVAVRGGPADSMDPAVANSTSDYFRTQAVFDRLFQFGTDGSVQPMLAESIKDDDPLHWTLKLRPGVKWQSGAAFTADDVVYSLRRIIKGQLVGSIGLSAVDIAKTKKVDDLTVSIVLKHPDYTIDQRLADVYVAIVRDGEKDFKKPDGTGPFMVKSFVPGERAVMTRNPHYWGGGGKPYLQGLTFVNLPDEQARVNALRSGQVDLAMTLPPSMVPVTRNDPKINLVAQPGLDAPYIYLRMDTAPFKDNRVRTAMKLALDRERCLKVAWLGYGQVANDVFGLGLADYDKSLPQRKYDPAKAKQLLKEAGVSNLKVTLSYGPSNPGMTECGQVFQQSAKAAGITIKIHRLPETDNYNPEAGFGSRQMGFDTSQGGSFSWVAPLGLLTGAPIQESHQASPEFDRLFRNYEQSRDSAERQKWLNAAQQWFWNNSGYIIWGYVDQFFGARKSVVGLDKLARRLLNSQLNGFEDVWVKKGQ
jgi:peptide/nickel transport system substrate-binding protein